MKKIILILLIITSVGLKAQTYHKFLNKSSWCNIMRPGFGLPDVYTVYSQRLDTIIRAIKYAKITRNSGTSSIDFLREDTIAKKVYKYNSSGADILMYDFSLSVGDTFYVNSDTTILSLIDTINTLQGIRRCLNFTKGSFLYHFIEGVGSGEETILRLPFTGLDPLNYLVCSYQNNLQVYDDLDNSTACWKNAPDANLCFNPYYVHTSGYNPNSVVSADFNGDGLIDIVTSEGGFSYINISLGLGTGYFSSPVSFPTNCGAYNIITTDFNNDGNLDVAVEGCGLSALLGDGLGGFGPSINNSVGGFGSFANGDFNSDGFQDLAVADQNGSTTAVVFGNGIGGFSTQQNFTAGNYQSSIICEDFNNDGKKDIATGCNGGIGLLLGNGAGNFAPVVYFNNSVGSTFLTSADFNKDGNKDLAYADIGTNKVYVLFGNGLGNFSTPLKILSKNNLNVITSADINGDGNIDLITGSGNRYNGSTPGTITILSGNGMGNFILADTFVVANGPVSIAVADFNGNGHMDLATTTYTASNSVSILLDCDTSSFTTGIKNHIKSSEKVNIFPNPAYNLLNVTCDIDNTQFKIINILGNVILEQKEGLKEMQIDVSKLNQGVYIVKILTEQGLLLQSKKIIILRN